MTSQSLAGSSCRDWLTEELSWGATKGRMLGIFFFCAELWRERRGLVQSIILWCSVHDYIAPPLLANPSCIVSRQCVLLIDRSLVWTSVLDWARVAFFLEYSRKWDRQIGLCANAATDESFLLRRSCADPISTEIR